jgi:hypothetical protein
MIQLPFNIQVKENFRMPTEPSKYQFKAKWMEGRTQQEIAEEMIRRNELRMLVKDIRIMEKSLLSNYRSASISGKLDSTQSHDQINQTYVQRQYKKMMAQPIPDINKMTMKKVEKFQYADMKRVDDQFNPKDLIDDNDEEDNMYLAEYKIAEKKRLQEDIQSDKRKIEEYGRLKKASKGFAVNGRYANSQRAKHVLPDVETSHSPSNYIDYIQPKGHSYNYGSPSHYGITKSNPSSVKHLYKMNSPGSGPTYLDYDLSAQPQIKSLKKHHPNVGGNQGYAKQNNIYINNTNSSNNNNNSYNSGYRYAAVNNGYYASPKGGYHSAMDRANQIEYDSRRKEQQMMINAMNIQSSQLKKGLKIVGK